ncbi:MAG TPA: hypothetical protein PK431_09990 [Chitinophagales bacterium]|nr:hypothetical protein [Chitinophagales bacterium]
MGTINNFKLVKNATNEKPPYLEDFGEILGYKVYSSSFNSNLYVVYDNDELYYCFENIGNSIDIQTDLGWCIRTYIIRV